MQAIRNLLEKRGYHAFLLPVFFVFHHFIDYYGLLSAAKAVESLLLLLSLFAICFIFLRLFTRSAEKRLQLTTLYGAFILFYGVIKDAIASVPAGFFLSRYSVLLPVLCSVCVVISVRIFRKTIFHKSNLYLNLLLSVFLVVDIFSLWMTDSKRFLDRNLLVDRTSVDSLPTASDSALPDIYYLVFDSYPGSEFLKEQMQYDNHEMDSLLRAKGWFVAANPRSNYNRTAFSIASTLNFQYLKGITEETDIESQHYNKAQLSIRYALVPSMLLRNGYAFHNLSIFTVGGQDPLRKETFLTTPESWVIYYNTLPGRLVKDVLWNFITGPYPVPFLKRWTERYEAAKVRELVEKRDFNIQVIDSIGKLASISAKSPQFVYAHVYLPHPPFFYDSLGNANDLKTVLEERSLKSKELFLSYLKYTNQVILQLADTINGGARPSPIIILQSDHGFRDYEGGTRLRKYFFTNYSAFYYPDRDYRLLYDSMSNINTFPVIFNKYFRANISLQPDSVIYLPY